VCCKRYISKTTNQSTLLTLIQFVPHSEHSALNLQTKFDEFCLGKQCLFDTDKQTHTHTYCVGKMQCSLLLNLAVHVFIAEI